MMTTKTWGEKVVISETPMMITELLYIKKDGYCSWHSHKRCTNWFYVVSGKLELFEDLHGPHEVILSARDNYHIMDGINHIFYAHEDSVVLEVTRLTGKVRVDIKRHIHGGDTKEGYDQIKKDLTDEINIAKTCK